MRVGTPAAGVVEGAAKWPFTEDALALVRLGKSAPYVHRRGPGGSQGCSEKHDGCMLLHRSRSSQAAAAAGLRLAIGSLIVEASAVTLDTRCDAWSSTCIE